MAPVVLVLFTSLFLQHALSNAIRDGSATGNGGIRFITTVSVLLYIARFEEDVYELVAMQLYMCNSGGWPPSTHIGMDIYMGPILVNFRDLLCANNDSSLSIDCCLILQDNGTTFGVTCDRNSASIYKSDEESVERQLQDLEQK